MTRSLGNRLMSKVDTTPGHGPNRDCWLWTGQTKNGYGTIKVKGKWKKVHRLAYELFNRPIPEGHEIRHTCHVRRCVSPGHLLTGTRQDNMDDMVKAGRQAKGERHGRSKVSDRDRQWIRWLHANGVATQQELSRAFGVTCSHITVATRSNSKSRHGTGVYLTKRGDRFRALATIDGRVIHIGTFDTPEEAQNAREGFLDQFKKTA